jgi:hypothetical protein
MDGNGVLWKLSDNRQNLVSGSLLFVKQLFDGQYAKDNRLGNVPNQLGWDLAHAVSRN